MIKIENWQGYNIRYEELSDEEKEALIEICKEDPIIFIEKVCGILLLEYQKEYIRRVFREIRKRNHMADITSHYIGKPVSLKGHYGEQVIVEEWFND